jgi:hypothetical protein
MDITLTLSPERNAELEKLAAAAGTDVTGFILDAVVERLEERSGSPAEDLPYEHWKNDFHSWISSHLSRNPGFDDSRDSIYD